MFRKRIWCAAGLAAVLAAGAVLAEDPAGKEVPKPEGEATQGVSPNAPARLTTEQKAQIEKWVAAFGETEYQKREAAYRELEKWLQKNEALEEQTQAFLKELRGKQGDMEVQSRIDSLLAGGSGGPLTGMAAGYQIAATKALRASAEAEAVYKKTINPGNYSLTLAGLTDNGKPMLPPDVMAGKSRGYVFAAIPKDESGTPYTATTGYAFCACPEKYRKTGQKTFIIDCGGTVYEKDTKGKPPTQWPAADPTTAGWAVSQ